VTVEVVSVSHEKRIEYEQRDVARDRCLAEIEREMGVHLDVSTRVNIAFALERFEAEVAYRVEREGCFW
jgi:hypothetical protein